MPKAEGKPVPGGSSAFAEALVSHSACEAIGHYAMHGLITRISCVGIADIK